MAKLDGVIHQAKSKNRPEGMKKDRKTLEKLGLMMWPNNNG